MFIMADHSRAKDWVASLPSPNLLESPQSLPSPRVLEVPESLECPKSLDSSFFLCDLTPPTPLETGSSMAYLSTPKRRQTHVKMVYDDDNDPTPRASARHHDAGNGGPNVNDEAPHEPSTGKRKADMDEPTDENGDRGRPPAKKPKVESLDCLSELETPVCIEKWDTYVPPADDPYKIENLRDSINKAKTSLGILPQEIRQRLVTKLNLKDHQSFMFRNEPIPKDVIPASGVDAEFYARYELQVLENIQEEVEFLYMKKAHECGWSSAVFEPILRHVFNRRELRVVNVATATIEGDSMPNLRHAWLGELTPALSVTELTDYDSTTTESTTTDSKSESSTTCQATTYQTTVLTRDPNLPKHVQTRRGTKIANLVVALELPRSNELQKRINSIIERVPGRHVNQTSYECIGDSVIALSVGAAKEFSGVEPLIQLGIWTAAWHKRMMFLRGRVLAAHPQSLDQDEKDKLLFPVPLLTIAGTTWSLYLAFFESESIDIRLVAHTSTGNLADMYVLVAWLRVLKKWIEDVFAKELRDWFIIPKKDVGNVIVGAEGLVKDGLC
ncbi:hypothetical protein F4679DRAFT_598547 [Xylaria curta]|nr:hypothetical protein F4679DRAFT_598547 [Xylaria curta]